LHVLAADGDVNEEVRNMNDKLQIDEIDEFTTASRIHGTPNALGDRVEIAANGQIFTRGFIGVVARLGVPPKQRSLVRDHKS
jgi:hypothetical protein